MTDTTPDLPQITADMPEVIADDLLVPNEEFEVGEPIPAPTEREPVVGYDEGFPFEVVVSTRQMDDFTMGLYAEDEADAERQGRAYADDLDLTVTAVKVTNQGQKASEVAAEVAAAEDARIQALVAEQVAAALKAAGIKPAE